jgi:hypothetical protein
MIMEKNNLQEILSIIDALRIAKERLDVGILTEAEVIVFLLDRLLYEVTE